MVAGPGWWQGRTMSESSVRSGAVAGRSDGETIGSPAETLDDATVRDFVLRNLAGAGLAGRSVCVIVPDGTRSCPLPLLLDAIADALRGKATRITVLIALGTHAAMTLAHLERHLRVR